MTEEKKISLGNTLWKIACTLRGAMNADDFRDYMLSFLFLRYLSENYENIAKDELGDDYPDSTGEASESTALQHWYKKNKKHTKDFEGVMHRRMHYVIKPEFLWSNIARMAKTHDADLLDILKDGFDYIENKSFKNAFRGLFSEIQLDSDKLGKTHAERNKKLSEIIFCLDKELADFTLDEDILGDAYEYLIEQFAAGGGKKAGEFYTPQKISSILSHIVALDGQNPTAGKRKQLKNVLDFACGSGSLLLNVRKQFTSKGIGKIYGQENNITTYNLARMNMLLHGVKDSEFDIFHGDTLKNEWDMLREENPARKPSFDAVVANPPFSLSWDAKEDYNSDVRFKEYGIAPRSAADFAFLLHGFHYLKPDGVMAIIMPHGILFRSGSEKRIREKLIKDGNIDTVIGLPFNLFYSTGIPVCILVLKKCKKTDDILFINAKEHFEKVGRLNHLRDSDIEKIVNTYTHRKNETRFSRCVSMREIKKEDYNLNINRYVSTEKPEEEIDLKQVNKELHAVEKEIKKARKEHNKFLKELGLPELPG